MQITINDVAIEILPPYDLNEVIKQCGITAHTFAIALNGKHVPKACYSQIRLKENDKLEVLIPMQGG